MIRKHSNSFWYKLIIGITISALLLSGCSLGGGKIQGETATEAGQDLLKVGLVVGEGGVSNPYYQKAWEGLQKAEQELEIGVAYIEAKTEKDYRSRLAELRKQKYDVIITIGQAAVPAVLEAAENNTKIKYICLDSGYIESSIPSNLLAVSYKVEEAAFLAGYLAGKMTKSYVVGFVSGDNKEAAQRYYYGFKAGIKYSNNSVETMKGLAGTFTKKSRLKEIAERMIAGRADVLFHVAGPAGEGLIEVAAREGKHIIGSEIDQKHLAPENVLTSVLLNNDQVIYDLLELLKANKLQFGKKVAFGLAENAVDLAEINEDKVSEYTINQLRAQKEKIIAGDIAIPANENEYLSF
ncbi:MAG: BMP family ABC transporter substrate-binding protein [Peptococcaceae bacterium]|jgi:basic membrane protein A|nr:BMP family ABC transporter substrate-binding protein [Peptococcaceae bacterium]